MSTPDGRPLRDTIRQTLAHHAGGAPDASAYAEATLSIWRLVVARLSPVIGSRGVEVLIGRSVQLTSGAFPWLTNPGTPEHNGAPLAHFKSCLLARETADAAAVSHTLLVTFTELLESLIGEALTERLLGPVWAPPLPPPPASKQERTT